MQDTDREAVRAGLAVPGGWHPSDLRRPKTEMCVRTLRSGMGGRLCPRTPAPASFPPPPDWWLTLEPRGPRR